jgi:hypothetical protein
VILAGTLIIRIDYNVKLAIALNKSIEFGVLREQFPSQFKVEVIVDVKESPLAEVLLELSEAFLGVDLHHLAELLLVLEGKSNVAGLFRR